MQLACEECDRVTDDAHGWIAKVAEDDDELDTHLCVVLIARPAPNASSTSFPIAARTMILSEAARPPVAEGHGTPFSRRRRSAVGRKA